MSISPFTSMILVVALALGAAAQAAENPRASAKAAKAEAAAAADSIPYEELRYHLGERVVVQTKFNSTRIGTLTKASLYELILSVPTVQGPAELTMPKDTIVRVTPAETPKPPKPPKP